MERSRGLARGWRGEAVGYGALLAGLVASLALALGAAGGQVSADALAGRYRVTAAAGCLGDTNGEFLVAQSGRFLTIKGIAAPPGSPNRLSLDLRLDGDNLSGSGACTDGRSGALEMRVERAPGGELSLVSADRAGRAVLVERTLTGRHVGLSPEQLFARLMLAMAAILLAARVLGSAAARIGQPRVMGEVLAGILLGPTLLGAVAPGIKEFLFPAQVVPLLGAVANVGLALYMFLVGLEFDPRTLRGRVKQAAFISNASVALPMALGVLAAVPLFPILAPPDIGFLPFALFIGVSMSITAFPVLARILVERRMLRRPIGALVLAAAAVDDVTAWALLAVATAVATATRIGEAAPGAVAGAAADPALQLVRVVGLTVAFCLFMAVVVRRFLIRVAAAFDEAGHVPLSWIGLIFFGVLLSTATTGLIGVAPIFGAFVMGLVMPRREGLTQDVTRRIEDVVVIVLLPLFFVVAGLKTDVGLLRDPQLLALTGALTALAIVAKFSAASGAARWTGMPARESLAVGALMNTRGLTELIVLNLGLELDVITPALFTILVIMALVTTFMTGPLLSLIDRAGTMTSTPEEELRAEIEPPLVPDAPAPPRPRTILVMALDDRNLDALIEIAGPLAGSAPQRDLVLVRLLDPGPITSGTSALGRRLEETHGELIARQRSLADIGVRARVAALTSVRTGRDLVDLGGGGEIDLILVDGRRPVVGRAILGGPVGTLLENGPSDVAVLLRRGAAEERTDPTDPIVVPFGGAEHDWAALELGAWIAGVSGRPLRLVGTTLRADGTRGDPSRLLANASLVVQQLAGIVASPYVVENDTDGFLAAVHDARLVVMGLSDRWRTEGLGPIRSDLVGATSVPILFVRRGSRAGVLAPRDDFTRFTWSSPRHAASQKVSVPNAAPDTADGSLVDDHS